MEALEALWEVIKLLGYITLFLFSVYVVSSLASKAYFRSKYDFVQRFKGAEDGKKKEG